MQINITARHLELDAAFKAYVNDKLNRLSRYDGKIEEVRAVFSLEKFNYISEITLTGKKLRLVAVEKDKEIKLSFDNSIASLQKQLKRFRSKMRHRRVKSFIEGIKNVSFKKRISAGLPSRIVITDSFEMKPMSPEEAAMELEMFGKSFIVFRNSDTEKVNVLYQRKDGNYGLIVT